MAPAGGGFRVARQPGDVGRGSGSKERSPKMGHISSQDTLEKVGSI